MIIGHVRGQELKLDRTTIAADSIKYLEAEFHFAGRDWDGYVKTAYFINGASKFALVLADDRITADMGLNLTAGEWEVKLSGVKGDSRITTTTERIYLREFGGTEGTLPDVTPTQAEQLLAKIGDMAALETEAKNSLVAAINEAVKSSGGGSGGKDGTGIESITYKGADESGGNMYTVLLTDGTSYDITAPKGAKGDKGEDAAADLTLGLTGATVGQIAKIAAVDASGVPTARKAASVQHELLTTINITEEIGALTVAQDDNGGSFTLNEVLVYCDSHIGEGHDYKTITYQDNNGLNLTVDNALSSNRVTQFLAKNSGGFYFDEGFWATSEGSRYSQFYRNATSKAFEPINTIKLTFGETVTQGRIQVWGIRA